MVLNFFLFAFDNYLPYYLLCYVFNVMLLIYLARFCKCRSLSHVSCINLSFSSISLQYLQQQDDSVNTRTVPNSCHLWSLFLGLCSCGSTCILFSFRICSDQFETSTSPPPPPPPWAMPWAFELLKIDRSNSCRLGPNSH